MNKVLVPLVVSLAACGAATAAMIAGNATAQPEPRRPVMVAMTASHLPVTAAPAGDGGTPLTLRRPTPSPAEMAARRGQICRDEYAHQVGEVAYLEARLSLTAAQQPLFDRWKDVKLDIAKRGQADCSTRELPRLNPKTGPSPLDGMAREEDILKRRIADLEAERPALAALYNALNATQREALMHPGDMMMGGGHMMGRHDFGPDHGGPADRPMPPPAQ